MTQKDGLIHAEGPLPQVALCVPGPWHPERDLQMLKAAVAGLGFNIDLKAGPREEGLRERFEADDAGGEHALGASELAAIDGHTASVYVLSARNGRQTAAPVAHAMLTAANALLALGGLGLSCESSRRAHSPRGVRALLADADAARTKLAALRKSGRLSPDEHHQAKRALFTALTRAYLRLRDDDDVLTTEGLHLLGQPEAQVRKTDVDGDLERARALLGAMALHLTAELDGRLRPHETFSDADGSRWSLTHVRSDRIAPDSFQFDAWGQVLLTRLAADAAAPVDRWSALSPDAARRIHRVLAFLAAADGKVDPTEQEVLNAYRARLAIPEAEAVTIELEGAQGKGIVLDKDPTERELLQAALLEVLTADGAIADGELRRLRKVVATLALAPRDLIPPLRAILA